MKLFRYALLVLLTTSTAHFGVSGRHRVLNNSASSLSLQSLARLQLCVKCGDGLTQSRKDAKGNRTGRDKSAEETTSTGRDVYIFSYFKGNGEDGLHLAYSDDGLVWRPLNGGKSLLQPTVGRSKLMRDPQIIMGRDGLFHMVWTTSWNDQVIGYATSKDLINWSRQRGFTPMKHEPTALNVWAPELFYDSRRREYLLFWSTTIPGRFPETDRSGDNGRNHRIYMTRTKDFRRFTPTHLFYDQGFSVIDATILKTDRRYVMIFKDETRWPEPKKNLHYATSDRAAGPYGEASPPITGNYWAEGPTAIKIDGRWIIYFDKYREHRYGAVASSDWTNWEDISAQLQFPEGARHGTVLNVSRAVVTRLLELK